MARCSPVTGSGEFHGWSCQMQLICQEPSAWIKHDHSCGCSWKGQHADYKQHYESCLGEVSDFLAILPIKMGGVRRIDLRTDLCRTPYIEYREYPHKFQSILTACHDLYGEMIVPWSFRTIPSTIQSNCITWKRISLLILSNAANHARRTRVTADCSLAVDFSQDAVQYVQKSSIYTIEHLVGQSHRL